MSVANTTSNPKTQGALAAGIGALVGIVAFLLLPYFNFTVTVTDNSFNPPQTNSASITAGTGLVSVLAGLVWVEALLAIAVLVIAVLLLSKNAPFGASTAPVETQVRRAGYAVIILGIAAIAYHFLFMSSIGPGQMYSLFQSLTTSSNNVTNTVANQLTQSHISGASSMTNAIGSWIYIVGMVVAIVGGGLVLRSVLPQAAAQPQNWPQYAQYSQPSQPSQSSQPQQPQPQAWPQPSQPQPQAWPQQAQQSGAWPQQPQPQQQGWQPTQQAQPPQGWQQPPQQEQRWQQPPHPQ